MQVGTQDLRFTERDEAILVTLTHRVKVLSSNQIRKTWWPAATHAVASARVGRLVKDGWLRPMRVTTRSITVAALEPLAYWSNGDPIPRWPEILRRARSRWRSEIRFIPAFVASSRAAQYFGGHARYPRPSEGGHDLLLSDVYLRYLAIQPEVIAGWKGEGAIAAANAGKVGVIPDAMIDRRGEASVALEVVGESYGQDKLRAFHECCAERRWRYQLW
jgi:hypothetical protein